jgi:DNA-3-methyladenine glycosylase I
MKRCPWCPEGDSLYQTYHDEEWGVPQRDGLRLFAMLNLEGAQAGLNWRTVLAKRPLYEEVFTRFIPEKIASWAPAQVEAALSNPGIIRNRRKVEAVVNNAQAVMTFFQGDLTRWATFIWGFVNDAPRQNNFTTMAEVPAQTQASEQMSRALKKVGFTFVGPTICYAYMQAVGLVNDHLVSCPRHAVVKKLGAAKLKV